MTATFIGKIRKYFEQYSQDVDEALSFLEWLENQKLSIDAPSIHWTAPVYRAIYGNYNPLSIAGSLSRGGRFNIGGAQRNHFFSHLKMQACLYAASSIECAIKEAGEPIGHPKYFELKPHKSFNLWDLDLLIAEKISYPTLKSSVDASPLSAIWEYQKVPKISQILGGYLRNLGGDGIIYPSTKDPTGLIFAFFAHDEAHAQTLFTI